MSRDGKTRALLKQYTIKGLVGARAEKERKESIQGAKEK